MSQHVYCLSGILVPFANYPAPYDPVHGVHPRYWPPAAMKQLALPVAATLNNAATAAEGIKALKWNLKPGGTLGVAWSQSLGRDGIAGRGPAHTTRHVIDIVIDMVKSISVPSDIILGYSRWGGGDVAARTRSPPAHTTGGHVSLTLSFPSITDIVVVTLTLSMTWSKRYLCTVQI
jgi:hypothetical protein